MTKQMHIRLYKAAIFSCGAIDIYFNSNPNSPHSTSFVRGMTQNSKDRNERHVRNTSVTILPDP